MVELKNTITRIILLATVLVALAGLVVPVAWVEENLFFFGMILLLAGIPHGASDLYIFLRLNQKGNSINNRGKFFLSYGLACGVYLLVWLLSPTIAFLLFLIISVYHFGQSNWSWLERIPSRRRVLTYVLWGAAVLGVPVLLHFEESSSIIAEITGKEWSLSPSVRGGGLFLLLLSNLVNIVELYEQDYLSKQGFRQELFKFVVLMWLFFCTPLLVGFGVYFVLWHSLESTLDQFAFFKQQDRHFNWKKLIRITLPLSVAAFVGLWLVMAWWGDRFNQYLNVGLLFMFISIITVPHSLLMDRLYIQSRN